MLVITVTHHDRTPDMPRPGVDRDHGSFSSHRVGMPQLRHVPASMGGLLYMRDMSAVGGMRGTRMGRFRKSSGGQTKDQNKVRYAPQKLSVHRELSSRNHGI